LADPEVTVMSRDYDKDDFILLACDGIFDVMSNVTCIKFVQTKLKKNPTNPKSVCCALLKRCLELGSRDNMSAVLVLFNKSFEPTMVAAKMARSDAQVCRDDP
jgi:serine/threonine protein phosphatase PrpC